LRLKTGPKAAGFSPSFRAMKTGNFGARNRTPTPSNPVTLSSGHKPGVHPFFIFTADQAGAGSSAVKSSKKHGNPYGKNEGLVLRRSFSSLK
jgi:hypothetical protein